MNDKTKTIITVLGIGAAAYLIYQWLQSSGLWAQWFGGALANTFSNPQQLLAYCQANPTGTATYQAAGGSPISAPCSSWLSANATTTPPPTTPSTAATAQAPSQASAGLSIPSNLTVTPNINNSLSGDVILNGVSTNLSIITGNAGQSAGVIYNTAGQDITSQFTAAQQQQLIAAFTAAPHNAGVSGLDGGYWAQNPYAWKN